MKEKIYTIPVNDAFSSDCECPICSMYKALEDDAVSYTMGPSYMEDDIRAVTDKKGFCQKHLKKVYDCENRLSCHFSILQTFNIINHPVKMCLHDKCKAKSVLTVIHFL